MIRLAGLRPTADIEIEITGLRPGEKLHEELLHDNEALLATSNPGLLLAEPRTGDIETLRKAIDQLTEFGAQSSAGKDIESDSSFSTGISTAEETAKVAII